jgi:hypothetical protein
MHPTLTLNQYDEGTVSAPLPKVTLLLTGGIAMYLCVLKNKPKIYKSIIIKCDKKYTRLDNMLAVVFFLHNMLAVVRRARIFFSFNEFCFNICGRFLNWQYVLLPKLYFLIAI